MKMPIMVVYVYLIMILISEKAETLQSFFSMDGIFNINFLKTRILGVPVFYLFGAEYVWIFLEPTP